MMLPTGLVAALAPGTVIGDKYRVERLLGTGGMGAVVAARHLELNQIFAIKVLLPSVVNSAEATTRFLREGRAAAQLSSPHVAKVHDTGRLPSGAPFLVMELLRGRDLRALLAETNRVPLAHAVEWVLQAAHALAEAHALNIIHRDVKPANLFLAETSTGPQIKVLDFGVSKQLHSAELDLTNTASVVGTPRYMPPEQMRSARFADVRGDVWSLGITLYELTTGEAPFQGDSLTALCFDVMERTPTLPSKLNPELPPAFDEIVLRCLEKDADDRFQSVEALAAALSTLAPGSRSSGLFNAAALHAAGPVSAGTPRPVSTPAHAGATRGASETTPLSSPATATFPLAQPPFPDLPPQETMQTWNTLASPRSVPKRTPHMLLVALGIGIGIAAATFVGMFVGNRDTASLAGRPGAGASTTRSQASMASTSAAPVAPAPVMPAPAEPATTETNAVVLGAEPPPAEPPAAAPPAASIAAPPAPSAPPKTTTPVKARRGCDVPYTWDEKGHKIPKPECP